MMNIIENIVNKYYVYRTAMLLTFCLITIVIMIGGFIIFKMKNEDLRYNINKLIYKIIYCTIIVGIGQILCLMGLMPKIEYVFLMRQCLY